MKTYLVTGGAGFVGSNLAVRLKRDYENIRVIALDNLNRRGSELNLVRLREHGVEFVHGDIRSSEDLHVSKQIDCILECSAEPSVLAGYNTAPTYVVNTNLVGMLNCLELARQHDSDFVFLSTSRVYPLKILNGLRIAETVTRFELFDEQPVPGISPAGLTEAFPLDGTRSLYGATKLAGELIMQEYLQMYNLRGVINRCGVITGPWQMGKVDQGVVVLWVARHIFGGSLRYIGFGGQGKQVRDILHIEDLYRLLVIQLNRLDKLNGHIFNVGGGRAISVSLKELTQLCERATGNRLEIQSVPDTRPADIPLYLSDCRKAREWTGWMPSISPIEIITQVTAWISDNRTQLEPILT
jgi:CDP-paratose 2-epimerase